MFRRIEASVAEAAVQLGDGDYDALSDVLNEFTVFSEHINEFSHQEMKPHMERLESVQAQLKLMLSEMELHKGALKDEMGSLKNSSNAAKAYTKSGIFSKRDPEES